MKESAIELSLVYNVQNKGGIAYKFTSPNVRGVPDRLVLLPLPPNLCKILSKYMFFVECKTPGKKPRAAQIKEHNRIRQLGYTVIIKDNLTSEDI